MTSDKQRRTYGVRLVRGPFVALDPHPRAAVDLESLLRQIAGSRRPLAADIFCGAGGLSLGLQAAGFDVVVGVDHDQTALETYANLFPGLTLDRDLADPEAVDEVIEVLLAIEPVLIAGGPPCQPFSRAGSSKIRSLVNSGVREAHDARRDLWEAFLDIVVAVRPPAVLLENVPEFAISDDMAILRTLVATLEGEGYGVHTRILKAVEHGVPQYRQRFFLVAIGDGGGFTWPQPVTQPVVVGDAIGDLPPVEGGWRPAEGSHGFLPYAEQPEAHPFLRRARHGLGGAQSGRVYDHITRPVRDDDRVIFARMNPRTLYSDLEEGLKRYRDDIFDDKYKRLSVAEPSRSITAHIARDGYWYIHPTQLRTLTVREAARLQTFPDRVRFAGPPSAAFRQIGNAVPPLLAEVVGRSTLSNCRRRRSRPAPSTEDTSARLAAWYESRERLALPWLEGVTEWQVIVAEIVLSRCAPATRQEAWEHLHRHRTPAHFLDYEAEIRDVLRSVCNERRLDQCAAAARWYESAESPFASVEAMARNPYVSRRVCELAAVVAGTGIGPILWSTPILRVAARWWGEPVDRVDRGSAGRITVARLIGGSLHDRDHLDTRQAQAALVELGHAVCLPQSPRCYECPLADFCASRKRLASRNGTRAT